MKRAGLDFKTGRGCPPLLGREQRDQIGKRSSLLCLDGDRPVKTMTGSSEVYTMLMV